MHFIINEHATISVIVVKISGYRAPSYVLTHIAMYTSM